MAANEQANGLPAPLAPAGRRLRFGPPLAIASVWAVAAVGGVLGAVTLIGDDAPPPPSAPARTAASPPHVGDRVLTSFGSFAVSSVLDLRGPASAMHLTVPRGWHPIQLGVTLNNLGRHELAVDHGWFRLVGPRGRYPVGYGTPPHQVASLSTRGVLLRFAIPQGARLPDLEYRDPSGGAPVRVELGSSRNLIWFNPATHRHGG